MSIPLLIAAAAKSGLQTALASVIDGRCTVYADGIADTESPDGDKMALPLVAVMVSECAPMGYRSSMRAYPITIEAVTHAGRGNDPDQTDLFAIASAVSDWLCNPPTLTITGMVFDALYFDQAPERSNDGAMQIIRWTGTVNTHKV